MLFQDLEEEQLPEISYLLTILCVKMPNEIKFLIQDERSKRLVANSNDQDNLICVLPKIRDEIIKVLPQKIWVFKICKSAI